MKKFTILKIITIFTIVLYFAVMFKPANATGTQYPIFDSTILDCSDVMGGNCITVTIKPDSD